MPNLNYQNTNLSMHLNQYDKLVKMVMHLTMKELSLITLNYGMTVNLPVSLPGW